MSADAIVSLADSLDELSYGKTRERYLAELYPHDAAAAARQMGAEQESCGLTCETILRRSEVDGTVRHGGQMVDALSTPIARRILTGPGVVTYLETLGRQRGLWCSPGAGRRPKPGDMVTILGPTHALTVTGWDGDVLESIDGGQPDEANKGKATAIKRCRRRWDDCGGRPYLIDSQGRVRDVWGWLEAGSLPTVSP